MSIPSPIWPPRKSYLPKGASELKVFEVMVGRFLYAVLILGGGFLLLCSSPTALGSDILNRVSLDPQAFKAITFKDIEPTKYERIGETLVATIHESSSALVKAFDAPRKIQRLGFSWLLEGGLKVADANAEQSKAGDDMPFRVGLMVKGPAPTVPFFAPAWVKAVRDAMALPTDKMIYFAVGTKSPPGTVWKSPYAASIETRAVASTKGGDGWNVVDHGMGPLEVVGIWLMGDGDNTKSNFSVKIRSLVLE